MLWRWWGQGARPISWRPISAQLSASEKAPGFCPLIWFSSSWKNTALENRIINVMITGRRRSSYFAWLGPLIQTAVLFQERGLVSSCRAKWVLWGRHSLENIWHYVSCALFLLFSQEFMGRRQWHPTSVLLSGKPHGRRNLVGCSPWGRWESDTTEQLHFQLSLSCTGEGHGNPLQCSCLENPRDGGAWWAAGYGRAYWSHLVAAAAVILVWLFAALWTAACQAPLSSTVSPSLLRFMSIELVMPSSHLILCRPLLLLPSVFPSIRVFSSESALRIRWPKYWSFSFNVSPSSEYSGSISLRIDCSVLLAVQGTLQEKHLLLLRLDPHTGFLGDGKMVWYFCFFKKFP